MSKGKWVECPLDEATHVQFPAVETYELDEDKCVVLPGLGHIPVEDFHEKPKPVKFVPFPSRPIGETMKELRQMVEKANQTEVIE